MDATLLEQPARGSAAREGKREARLLRLVGGLYFLSGFSASSFGRFATLFYLSRGLSAHEIGIIEAAQPAVNFFGNQATGLAADWLQHKKAVALIARAASSAVLCTLPIPWFGGCFSHILATMCVVSFFSVGLGLLDTYCLDLLGVARRGEYGKYRLWLAISWGVGNAVMGLVAEVDFDYNFIMFGVLNGLCLLLMALGLPTRTLSERKLLGRRKQQ